MSANYHKIVNSVAVLMSASHLLDSRKESNSTKLTVLSVIIDEVILDICHWLNSTIDTSLSCGSREETIADICQWISTFTTGLNCENQEEFLVSFVVLGLKSSLTEVDDPTLFGLQRTGLPTARDWIMSTEAAQPYRSELCSFLLISNC